MLRASCYYATREPRRREQRLATRDLELSVFATTEQHGVSAAEPVSRKEPAPSIAHVDEDVLAKPRIEVLDDPVPAPVAALRAQRDHPTALAPLRRRLDLHPDGLPHELRHEVAVRAVSY